MLVGVLLKQAAVALVLSVLLYAYSLIMGTSDAVLPWALKILMIALVTIAVFIYRRPFQHLFSAVGYGMIGSTERAEIDLQRSRATLRQNTLGAAAVAVPGFAAYRAARWARRNPGQAAALGAAAGAAGVGAVAAGATAAGAGMNAEDGALDDGAATTGIAPPEGGARAGSRSGLASRARTWAAAAVGDGARRSAPPLNLPSRDTPGSVPARANGAGAVPSRTAADAAAVAAGAGAGQAGAAPARPAQSGAFRTRPAPAPQPHAGPAPAGPAAASPGRPAPAAGPRRAPAPASPAPRPAAPAPAPRPAAPAPGRAAPAGPAPAAPSGSGGSGWPWRPGATTRQPQASPSAAPGAAPSGPSSRQGGPWADSSAGRQNAAPVRQPAPPSARQPAAPPARPPSSRPAAPPPARPSASPSAAPSPRPSPPPRPARQSGRPASAPDPVRRSPSDRQGGPWAGSAAGRQGATPGADRGSAGPPLTGGGEAGRPEGPGPFWLRPFGRRK